jgi:hypothetical protein
MVSLMAILSQNKTLFFYDYGKPDGEVVDGENRAVINKGSLFAIS